MLTEYKEVFDRLEAIEQEFRKGHISTPDVTDNILKELASYYAYLSTRITEKEIEKLDKSKDLVETSVSEAKQLGIKVNKSTMDRDIDFKLLDLVKEIMTLETKRNNCDKFISVCQSSLKSLDRERKFPY